MVWPVAFFFLWASLRYCSGGVLVGGIFVGSSGVVGSSPCHVSGYGCFVGFPRRGYIVDLSYFLVNGQKVGNFNIIATYMKV